jgi:GrpB-like predicted nucleotidyltransferase (UPF0157 family)
MSAGRIDVVPYASRWPDLFTDERRLLERTLAPWLAGDVHHSGNLRGPADDGWRA